MDWYEENIELEVRDIVRALRNEGINTTASCGHEMWIEANVTCIREDLRAIKTVLLEKKLCFDLTLKSHKYSDKEGIFEWWYIQILDPKKEIETYNTLDPDNLYESKYKLQEEIDVKDKEIKRLKKEIRKLKKSLK